MKTRHALTLFGIMTLITACGGGGTGDEDTVAMDNFGNEMMDDLGDMENNVEVDRKLIKTAYLTYEVDNLKSSEIWLRNTAKTRGGYITNESYYESDYQLSHSLEIKIPKNNYDLFMNDLDEGVGKFESKSVDVQDVTEEFIDVEARIKTKKEIEERYLALLDDAYTVEEMLLIEEQLGVLRSDIESFEGRQRYLKQSVAYSTIHVTMNQPIQNYDFLYGLAVVFAGLIFTLIVIRRNRKKAIQK